MPLISVHVQSSRKIGNTSRMKIQYLLYFSPEAKDISMVYIAMNSDVVGNNYNQ